MKPETLTNCGHRGGDMYEALVCPGCERTRTAYIRELEAVVEAARSVDAWFGNCPAAYADIGGELTRDTFLSLRERLVVLDGKELTPNQTRRALGCPKVEGLSQGCETMSSFGLCQGMAGQARKVFPHTTPTGHTYQEPTNFKELSEWQMNRLQGTIECWDDAELPPEETPAMFRIAWNTAVEATERLRELEAVAAAARAYHDPESCYVCSVPSPIDGRAGRLRCRLAVSLATLDASQRGEATEGDSE